MMARIAGGHSGSGSGGGCGWPAGVLGQPCHGLGPVNPDFRTSAGADHGVRHASGEQAVDVVQGAPGLARQRRPRHVPHQRLLREKR
jgi:hypothetical protein